MGVGGIGRLEDGPAAVSMHSTRLPRADAAIWLKPSRSLTRLIFYIFMGFGLLAALLTRFADALIETERKGHGRRAHAGCRAARR